MSPASASGATPHNESTRLLSASTLALLVVPRPSGTVVSCMALLMCPLAVCIVTCDGPVFGSPAAVAVRLVTRIVEHPKSAHMEGPEAAAGLPGLYTRRRVTVAWWK